MEKNGIYEGLVEGLGTAGEGIIKVKGTTAFVPFCITGERVTFKALKVKDGIAYGKLEKVLNKAYCRVNPPCPVFFSCGGCDLQHMNYLAQLEFKKQSIKSALSKLGGIYADVSDTVPCENEYRYRNKLVLPIGTDESGRAILGFYGARSHRIVPIDDCPIQSAWIKSVISAVKEYAKVGDISGALRHIVVREIGGKFIFALVARRKVEVKRLIDLLSEKFDKFTFLLNINDGESNVIFGKEWHICRGNGFYEAEECGIKYKAGALTFIQVNDDVRAKLYSAILSEAEKDYTAIDLYSGGGLLTAMLASKCRNAYGIEVVAEASACADELKALNGLEGKLTNICGKVEDEVDKVIKKVGGAKSMIVCDPPRKGMERSVVYAIQKAQPEKIVLVSCNPATLARDLGILTGRLVEEDGKLKKLSPEEAQKNVEESGGCGYEIKKVIPFDMFPQTKWCETLVVLSHKKPDGHINVKVEFGEEEGQVSLKEVAKRAEARKPKDKVTYKMMQNYIEKTYGFKVHTAYIAEVKRDLGLPMYDAPNAVEELKHPRPHPTPKMVEAIKETLMHFEII